ncbi:MAG TPA: hypothetical protein VE219_01940, partial [Candidatus Sulfotelmatobacter sp.]|nr:hypothetical protein [Candidatus Sulfotelmatobacter sp.]
VLGAAPFAQVLPAVSQVLPVATVAPVAQVLPVAPMVPAPAFPVALGQVLTMPLVAAPMAVGGGFGRVALPATGSAGLHLASPSSAGAELSTSLIAGLLLLASGLTLLGGRHVRRVIMNRKLA